MTAFFGFGTLSGIDCCVNLTCILLMAKCHSNYYDIFCGKCHTILYHIIFNQINKKTIKNHNIPV